jgi:CDP-Glycerol:Poly(glycerophosphate) glycerophosphotransferase
MSATVLFTGYAPVHYVCFRPLHAALERLPGVDVKLSGGLRRHLPSGERIHDLHALYDPFGIAAEAMLHVDELADLDVDVLVCANTKAIRPRSARSVVEIFHGLSFRNLAIREENSGKDAYFVLGPYMNRGLEARGVLSPGDRRGVRVGFPKTDALLDGTLDRDAILGREGLSGDRPVVVYAPTGSRHNSLELMGEDVLRRLKGCGAFDVLVKLHDHPKDPFDWRARLAPLEDEHFRVARGADVIDFLFAADLLITDASSVANEFALLDRPMVFLDVPELIEAARQKGAVDLDTWGRKAGEVIGGPADVVRAVADGLSRPERHSAVRRALAEDLFYNPGGATGVAVDWLREELAA